MPDLRHIILLAAVFCSLSTRAFAQQNNKQDSLFKFPTPTGFVNDYENILTTTQEKRLTKIIEAFEKKTSNEICIVSVSTILPYTNFAQYTTNLANAWGVGKKDKNNGLLIVLSKKAREVRIGTGLGTERILTDKICTTIVDKTMIPEFKKGNYFKGIKAGVKDIIKHWN